MFNIFTLKRTMNTYSKSKQLYIADHLSKNLAQPERRLNALKAIEKVLENSDPNLMNGAELFVKYHKTSFANQYEIWKGSPLSGAEKSVIVGIFKFSK
jgi:hypothetical protein